MKDWFAQNFKQVTRELLYEDPEGITLWTNNDSAITKDILQNEFGILIEQEIIDELISAIGPGWWSPVRGSISSGINRPSAITSSAHREMSERLDYLEYLIIRALPPYGGIGHNRPPVPIEEQPLSRREFEAALAEIKMVRGQADDRSPQIQSVERSVGLFRRLAESVGKWLAERANAIVDNAIGTALPISAVLAYGAELKRSLSAAVEAITNWIMSIQLPL